MDKAEAIRLATQFMIQQPDYVGKIVLDTTEAYFVQASKLLASLENDIWAVHFPMILPEEVLCQEPSTVIVEVDVVTKKCSIFSSL
jgi:hypothetical protein